MSFGTWFTSKISGAVKAITAPFTDPVPKPQPPVVVPIPDSGKPQIKLELMVHKPFGPGKFFTQSIPINSSCPALASKITGKKHWATVRLIVTEGTLTLKGMSASGPNNPTIIGSKFGGLGANSAVEWKLFIGPLTNTKKPGQTYEMSNYSIVTAQFGEILRVSCNVEHGSK